MAYYDEDIADAVDMITEFGTLCTWYKDGVPLSSIPIAFIPPGGSLAWLAALTGTAVPAGAVTGLMPGNVAIEPEEGDKIVRDSDNEQFILTGADLLAPNGQRILYTLRLVQ